MVKRTIEMKDVYSWIRIMSDPREYNRIDMYWRFSGALDMLLYLELITQNEMNAWLDYYSRKYIAETGA